MGVVVVDHGGWRLVHHPNVVHGHVRKVRHRLGLVKEEEREARGGGRRQQRGGRDGVVVELGVHVVVGMVHGTTFPWGKEAHVPFSLLLPLVLLCWLGRG